uniref:Ig-like domain-containing protein n=1 Tax=Cairina moschata TaxID=8855 RepID=A0A8C3C9R5_CAIMO
MPWLPPSISFPDSNVSAQAAMGARAAEHGSLQLQEGRDEALIAGSRGHSRQRASEQLFRVAPARHCRVPPAGLRGARGRGSAGRTGPGGSLPASGCRGAALLRCPPSCPAPRPAAASSSAEGAAAPRGAVWAGPGRAERWALPRRGPDLWCGQERPELGPALLLSACRRARQGPMAGGLGPRLLALALALALGPAGVWTELNLVESGGRLRAAGGSVQLSCQGSGLSFEYYDVWWYRQAPGGSLEWMSYLNSDGSTVEYSKAVEGRASVSRDNSQSKSSLSLSSLELKDSAHYFCAVPTGTGNPAEL